MCNGSDICPDHDDGFDTDADGTPDGCDGCPHDPNKTSPGNCGCGNPETACVQEVEPNNSRETATQLTLTDDAIVVRGHLNLFASEEEDYDDYDHFSFSAQEGDVITANLSGRIIMLFYSHDDDTWDNWDDFQYGSTCMCAFTSSCTRTFTVPLTGVYGMWVSSDAGSYGPDDDINYQVTLNRE